MKAFAVQKQVDFADPALFYKERPVKASLMEFGSFQLAQEQAT
jgi:hypothetical protein